MVPEEVYYTPRYTMGETQETKDNDSTPDPDLSQDMFDQSIWSIEEEASDEESNFRDLPTFENAKMTMA